jgi:hypothetical protein
MTTPSSPTDTLTGDRLRDALERRQNTADIIADQGELIELWRRPAAVADDAGGWVYPDGSDLAKEAAPVKRFFSYSLYEPLEGPNTPQGYGTHEKFVLIGMPDDVIKKDDVFYINGLLHRVDFVHPDRTYQTKAEGQVDYGG